MLTTKAHTELNHVENQRKWFNGTTIFVIIVSFVHMFYSIKAFSSEDTIDKFAAGFITGAIDLVTWRVSEYIVYERGKGRQPSYWAYGLFAFSLAISFILNLTYLVAHLPDTLNLYVAYLFAVLLAAFIPAVIGIIPMISAKLQRDAQVIEDEATEKLEEQAVQKTTKEDTIRKLIALGLNNSQIYSVIGGNRTNAIKLINSVREETASESAGTDMVQNGTNTNETE